MLSTKYLQNPWLDNFSNPVFYPIISSNYNEMEAGATIQMNSPGKKTSIDCTISRFTIALVLFSADFKFLGVFPYIAALSYIIMII